MTQPKKWTEVYPYGTKEGDEESKFFKALSRHVKHDWRSTSALVKATGLSQERVEEIIHKYTTCDPPLVLVNSSGLWGYWERNPKKIKKKKPSISQKDKNKRINKHIGNKP